MPTLKEIFDNQDSQEVREAIMTMARRMGDENKSSLQDFAKGIIELARSQKQMAEQQSYLGQLVESIVESLDKEIRGLLREIAKKEYPKPLPFPETQKVEISNPTTEVSLEKPAWWDMPS